MMSVICLLPLIFWLTCNFGVTPDSPQLQGLPLSEPSATVPNEQWKKANTYARRRRQAHRSGTRVGQQCSNGTKRQEKTMLCAQVKQVISFKVPFSTPTNVGGQSMTQLVNAPNKNEYYMMVSRHIEGNYGKSYPGSGWAAVVAYTGKGWSARDYAALPLSKNWANYLNITKLRDNWIITLDYSQADDTTECVMTHIFAYVSGREPCVDILICKDPQTSPGIQYTFLGRPELQQQVTVFNPKQLDHDKFMYIASGYDAYTNTWIQAAQKMAMGVTTDCVVCMRARPTLLPVQALPDDFGCSVTLTTVQNRNNLGNCVKYVNAHPLQVTDRQPPNFWKPRSGNYTCIEKTECPKHETCTFIGNIPLSMCKEVITSNSHVYYSVQRDNLWWWCGSDILRGHLLKHWTGRCSLTLLIFPAHIILKVPETENKAKSHDRVKRSGNSHTSHFDAIRNPTLAPDPTYFDSIGVPRGVPEEYKLADQVAAGFENLPFISNWFPITPNKNVDRLNYLHYKLLRLTNYTIANGRGLAVQLHATSLTAYQNRMALDMLLAKDGGVCTSFGDQCCTFIPNNTAPDGIVTQTLLSLQMFSDKMHADAGIQNPITEWMQKTFGSWKNIMLSAFTSLVIWVVFFVLCGCCVFCVRALTPKV